MRVINVGDHAAHYRRARENNIYLLWSKTYEPLGLRVYVQTVRFISAPNGRYIFFISDVYCISFFARPTDCVFGVRHVASISSRPCLGGVYRAARARSLYSRTKGVAMASVYIVYHTWCQHVATRCVVDCEETH